MQALGTTVSFIPKNRSEWVRQARAGVLVIASLVWLSLFIDGVSTGLGIYRHPTSCWIAAVVALIALVPARAKQRWWVFLALAFAVGGALYGDSKNASTRDRWQRFEARQHAAELSQPNTNK